MIDICIFILISKNEDGEFSEKNVDEFIVNTIYGQEIIITNITKIN